MAMTEKQAEFFRRLCRPFAPNEVRKRQDGDYYYVRARTIQNRLDDVCGVDGWQVEYREGSRGYMCALSIRMPDVPEGRPDGWLTKEDGGGFGDMKTKVAGESVIDTENDEKSAYTGAFKRAATAWGIGRYFHGEGVPEYLKPEFEGHTQQATPASSRPAQQSTGGSSGGGSPPASGRYNNFDVPRSNRALFPWVKAMQAHYGIEATSMMDDWGKTNGADRSYKEWNETQTREGALHVIAQIKGLPNYKGELDHVVAGGSAGQPTGNSLTALKKELLAVVQEIGKLQLGSAPDMDWVKSALSELAQATEGVGETIPSLKEYTFEDGLKKILAGAKEQLRLCKDAANTDDIPF